MGLSGRAYEGGHGVLKRQTRQEFGFVSGANDCDKY